LPAHLRDKIEDPKADVFISAVCAWEIASKVARGRWPEAAGIPAIIDEVIDGDAFLPLPVTIEHARVAGFLPGRHRDPFDRMLAAQAKVESLPLMTVDAIFQEFGIHVIW
jgi:PIN domain nuclease of toxin-antitoxin system